VAVTVYAVALVVVGALAGGFVSGLAGFGTGLAAMGIWLRVLDPASAATLAAICSAVAQAQTIPAIWHAIDVKRLAPMLLAGLVGVPVGTVLLHHVNVPVFRISIGVLLIGFSTFMLLGRARPQIAWGGRWADSVVAFGGGVLGGLAGLSGPLPTVWATLRGWSRDVRRGVFQMFNMTILSAVFLWHAATGLVSLRLVVMIALAMPGTFLGAWLGARSYRRLSDRRAQEVVLVLLLLSGLTLLFG
jgi:uncharacterized protein